MRSSALRSEGLSPDVSPWICKPTSAVPRRYYEAQPDDVEMANHAERSELAGWWAPDGSAGGAEGARAPSGHQLMPEPDAEAGVEVALGDVGRDADAQREFVDGSEKIPAKQAHIGRGGPVHAVADTFETARLQ